MKRPPRKHPPGTTVSNGGGSGGTNAIDEHGSGGIDRKSGGNNAAAAVHRYDALLREYHDGDEGALDIIIGHARSGDKAALRCMGKVFMQKMPTAALRYLEQAAAGSDGDPEAMYLIYSMHKQGWSTLRSTCEDIRIQRASRPSLQPPMFTL